MSLFKNDVEGGLSMASLFFLSSLSGSSFLVPASWFLSEGTSGLEKRCRTFRVMSVLSVL